MNDVKPWYESKIIWAQIIAIVFAIAAIFRFDVGAMLGMDEAKLLALVMMIVGVATVIFRGYTTSAIGSDPSAGARTTDRH